MKPLRIIVCLKPVPDPKRWGELALDPVTKTLRRERIPSVLDPLGKHALEEALRLREAKGGHVVVISMAPPSAMTILSEALCIGADSAVLLSDPSFAGADTLATAYVLSMGIRRLGGCDIVLCGSRSLDGGTAQVGPQLAEFLGVPHVTRVISLELQENAVLARAKLDEGQQLVRASLPVLLTVEKEINTPRLKSLMGILQVRNKTILSWGAGDIDADPASIGVAGSPTRVADVHTVDMKRRSEILDAPPKDAAPQLLERLRALGALHYHR